MNAKINKLLAASVATKSFVLLNHDDLEVSLQVLPPGEGRYVENQEIYKLSFADRRKGDGRLDHEFINDYGELEFVPVIRTTLELTKKDMLSLLLLLLSNDSLMNEIQLQSVPDTPTKGEQ